MKPDKSIKRITIEVIPHSQQRYNTCGDWQFDDKGNLTMRVSEMPKTGWKGPMLVAVHELVEAILCRDRDITTKMVDDFDLKFDPVKNDHEPGDDPKCPCRKEHCVATGIERILVAEFNLDWLPYEDEIIEMTVEYDEEHNERK
jgi:hypothetical protein